MKKDKFCINRTLFLLTLLILVSVGVFIFVGKVNNSKISTNSQAAFKPTNNIATANYEIWGSQGQTCGADDACDEGLKCYANSYNPVKKTCQTLSKVCGGINSPCCDTGFPCGTGLICNQNIKLQAGLEYFNPWGTGRCEQAKVEVGDYNQPCKYKIGDKGRCNILVNKGAGGNNPNKSEQLICLDKYIQDPWLAKDSDGNLLGGNTDVCGKKDEIYSSLDYWHPTPNVVDYAFFTNVVTNTIDASIDCGNGTQDNNSSANGAVGVVCKYNKSEDIDGSKIHYRLSYFDEYGTDVTLKSN